MALLQISSPIRGQWSLCSSPLAAISLHYITSQFEAVCLLPFGRCRHAVIAARVSERSSNRLQTGWQRQQSSNSNQSSSCSSRLLEWTRHLQNDTEGLTAVLLPPLHRRAACCKWAQQGLSIDGRLLGLGHARQGQGVAIASSAASVNQCT